VKRSHSHSDQPNALPIDDIEEAPAPSAKQLAAVIEIAREQVKLQRLVGKLQIDLQAAKQRLTANKSVLLPKAMDTAGVTATPLGGGAHVEIETIVTASVPSPNSDRVENAEERNAVGIEYCDKHCPDLVKNKVTAFFPKGLEKLFARFLRDLNKRKQQVEYTTERTVHGATLAKWVRGQDKLGKSVDEAALGVHRIKIAEVVLPKKKGKDKI